MLSPLDLAIATLIPAGMAAAIFALVYGLRRASAAQLQGDACHDACQRSVLAWSAAIAIGGVATHLGFELAERRQVAIVTAAPLAATMVGGTFHALVKPPEARHWLPAIAVLVVIASLLRAHWRGVSPAGLAIVWAFSALITGRLLYNSVYVQSSWKGPTAALWVGGFSLAMAVVWWLGGIATRHHLPDRVRYVGWGLSLALLAVTLVASGSQRYGLLAAGAASAMAGALLASLWLRRSCYPIAWSGAAAVWASTLILFGWFFADLRTVHVLLASAGLLLLSVPWPAGILARRPRVRSTVQLLVALIPTLTAAIWAATLFAQQTLLAPANPYDAYQ